MKAKFISISSDSSSSLEVRSPTSSSTRKSTTGTVAMVDYEISIDITKWSRADYCSHTPIDNRFSKYRRNASGFSLFVCLALCVANILRILFWSVFSSVFSIFLFFLYFLAPYFDENTLNACSGSVSDSTRHCSLNPSSCSS